MAEYIDKQVYNDAIREAVRKYPNTFYNGLETARQIAHDLPAADVRPVVLCGVCELHGHCYTEDVFAFARLAEENRFCAVGKVKTNGEKGEES